METVERLEATTISANRQPDGTLLVTAIPPEGGWRSSEGCGFEVATPGASGVTVSTDNGGIDVRGCAGLARLNASNGAVIVHDAGGAVEAETSNGRVEVHGSHGAVSAKTSNGAIVVDLAPDSPGPISAGTSNGSINLTLSPAYRGTLVVSTPNGTLHLPDAGEGITIRRDGKKTATLAVGEGGGSSDARTSNGAISVTRARATPG
jgi:DUF4097 and DUF4098 domain-containing protein YvlB